jgi:sortase B
MKKWICRILMLICIGVFAFSAYNLFQIYYGKHQVEEETESLEKHVVKEDKNKKVLSVDWDSLKAENSQIVAWIYVPDCEISFPVVQGEDNNYYLKHTTNGEYNERGAIFLDCEANSEFTDDNSIIYGHSVEGGGMFSLLKNFADSDFFSSHSVFYLLTPSCNYKCDVFAFSKTMEDSVFYTTSYGDYKDSVIQNMKTESTYVNELDVEGSMVTLSTCDLDYGFNSTHRLVLSGILHKSEDEIVLED